MSKLYDLMGHGYSVERRPDPIIFSQIRRFLGAAESVLNVGAGTGSYEPDDLMVVAVEPSVQMIMQRERRFNVVQARAEALPFGDGAFDVTMALLTLHHWEDQRKGLGECARVARRRVVIQTWDPASGGFWLTRDYFPELLAFDRSIFPSMGDIEAVLGPLSVQPLLIPADCRDGFLGAYWCRPHAYLDSAVRSGMSSFSRIGEVETRIEALQKDLASGAWDQRHRRLRAVDELDIGYRIVTAELH